MFKVKIFHKNKVVNLIRNFEKVLESCPDAGSASIMIHGFKKKDLVAAAKYLDDPQNVVISTNNLSYKGIILFYEN